MTAAAAGRPEVRVVVAGHVDHGKSTLIGRIRHEICALAGAAALDGSVDGNWAFAMDQLQEERERLMTVDTAQTFVETPGNRIVFIDVPGHQELIENMITGATRADHAVLVLAADEGVQVQTRRHALLLSLLGVRGVIVVVNKMDAVGHAQGAFRDLETAIVSRLAEVGIAAWATVPVVALTGENVLGRAATMPWYEGPLLVDLLADLEPATVADGPARLPVQDVYTVDGERVAVGRLLAGRLAEGESVVVLPAGASAVVREIRRFPADHLPAAAGESIGVVLDGAVLVRGDVVVGVADLPVVGERLAGRVFWMADEPLRIGDERTVRCATQAVQCRVEAIDERLETVELAPLPGGGGLAAMELATVTLQLAGPLVREPFARVAGLGRFVVEEGGRPLGFGIVPGAGR